jgi:hypothetical protein
MPTCYKLTKSDRSTHGGYLYKPGEWAEVAYTGKLCSRGVLHCYDTPEDAVFFDPIHARYLPDGILWEAEYDGPSVSDGTKRGVGRLRLIRPIDPPEMTTEQRIERAILAAKTICLDPDWNLWADKWLSGEDRSTTAAERAAARAWSMAAAWASQAAWSAESAAWAVETAAWAAARASYIKNVKITVVLDA